MGTTWLWSLLTQKGRSVPDKQVQLSADKRSQFERLVCQDGLGYCCPYALFRVTKNAGAIALRLGLHKRTVQLWKARFRIKEIRCEKHENCMIQSLRRAGK